MSSTARYFVGGGHTTANRGNLTQRLRCFALRIKMLRCRRPLRDFSSCLTEGAIPNLNDIRKILWTFEHLFLLTVKLKQPISWGNPHSVRT